MNRTTSQLFWLTAILSLCLIMFPGCGGDDSTNPGSGMTTRLFDSGNVPNGSTFQFAFADSGMVPYHCEIHPIMRGTVTIASGQADSAIVQIVNPTANGFSPKNVSIRPGGFVRWVNASVTHTVTSDS